MLAAWAAALMLSTTTPLVPPSAFGSVTGGPDAVAGVPVVTLTPTNCPRLLLRPTPMKMRSCEPLVKISVIGEHSALAVPLNENVVLGVPADMPITALAAALDPPPSVKTTVGGAV